MSWLKSYCRPLLHLKLVQEAVWLDMIIFLALLSTILQLSLLHTAPLALQTKLQLMWIFLLMAFLLTLPRLFEAMWREGILTYYQVVNRDLMPRMLVYLGIYWLSLTIPLLLALPLVALLLSIPLSYTGILLLIWLIASPGLLGIGAIGASLTLGLQNSALLICVLILPLYVPIILIGAKLLVLVTLGLPLMGAISLLLAMTLLVVLFSPFAIVGALRCHL